MPVRFTVRTPASSGIWIEAMGLSVGCRFSTSSATTLSVDPRPPEELVIRIVSKWLPTGKLLALVLIVILRLVPTPGASVAPAFESVSQGRFLHLPELPRRKIV